MEQITVLKIGGSLLCPDADKMFDFAYAENLKRLIKQIDGRKFILSTGGGNTSRKYQKAATEAGFDLKSVHQVGVAITNLHSELLQGVFGDLALDKIYAYRDFEEIIEQGINLETFGDKKVLMAAAAGPGKSNDWNALELTLAIRDVDNSRTQPRRVIDVKNIDGVYTADPRLDPTAERIADLSWDEYLNVIGNPSTHTPGASYPVDPVAASVAKENDVEFVVIGPDIENLRSAILGQPFEGSRIMG